MRQTQYPSRTFLPLGGLIGLLLTTVASASATSGEGLRNLDDFIQDLRLQPLYEARGEIHPLKIAILDNGFQGFENELGKSLPANTQFHPGPIAGNGHDDPHGLVMAQLLSGLMTGGGSVSRLAPSELHLYRTFGFDNFKAAVEDAIERKVDLILYSQVWEYGGNGDGTGFIDRIVKQATRAGIVWVNAAGDFGTSTYSGPIHDSRETGDDWVELPDPNQALQLRCRPESGHVTCPVRLVLSWNDFKDDVELGTDKDLDLVLTDDTLNIVQSSTLVQVKKTDGQAPGQSLYPREILVAELKAGLYYIRVKDRSHNFGARDRLRITASGESILMPRHTEGETLLNPADLPEVITVGASDTAISSESRSMHKPELRVPSLIRFGDSVFPAGSSSAAAAAAAELAILKSLHPAWNRATLLGAFSSRVRGTEPGLSVPFLGFGPTGPGCFALEKALPSDAQARFYVSSALQSGGVLVATTQGPKILFSQDPISLIPGLSRTYPDDALVLDANAGTGGGVSVVPRSAVAVLGAGYYELAQLPRGEKFCGGSQQSPPAAFNPEARSAPMQAPSRRGESVSQLPRRF